MDTNTRFENGCLTITRIYDAPHKDVFDAWIETSKVEQWWGCAETTSVKSEIEPKTGGKYSHLMTLNNADKIPSGGVLIEFNPPENFAFESPGMTPNSVMTVRVEFIELGDKTEVRLTHDNLPNEISKFVRAGWSAAFGKLDTFLRNTASAS